MPISIAGMGKWPNPQKVDIPIGQFFAFDIPTEGFRLRQEGIQSRMKG